jgi:hypothetical protein
MPKKREKTMGGLLSRFKDKLIADNPRKKPKAKQKDEPGGKSDWFKKFRGES